MRFLAPDLYQMSLWIYASAVFTNAAILLTTFVVGIVGNEHFTRTYSFAVSRLASECVLLDAVFAVVGSGVWIAHRVRKERSPRLLMIATILAWIALVFGMIGPGVSSA